MKGDRETFADMVGSLPPPGPVMRRMVSVARQNTFTDADGVRWQRRGDVADKRFQRLLNDPEVRVLHDYLEQVTEVPPAARGEFWASARASMDASRHSTFVGTEFRDDRGAHLLVITEAC